MADGPVGVRVQGLRELTRALRGTEQRADKSLTRGLRVIARGVRDRVRNEAPKRTGRMASTIRHSAGARGAKVFSRDTVAYVNEYGRKQRAPYSGQHYMRRGVAAARPETERQMGRLLDDIADGFGDS